MVSIRDLQDLAPLFAYPDEDTAQTAAVCAARFGVPDLDEFAARMAGLPLAARQEAFVAAFDMNPAAALEVGWHVFGEQYERGAFLVDLRQRLRAAGITESGELPDHLSYLLRLVVRMDEVERRRFATTYLAPALEKIASAVPADNPFAGLVRAAHASVAAAVGTSGEAHV